MKQTPSPGFSAALLERLEARLTESVGAAPGRAPWKLVFGLAAGSLIAAMACGMPSEYRATLGQTVTLTLASGTEVPAPWDLRDAVERGGDVQFGRALIKRRAGGDAALELTLVGSEGAIEEARARLRAIPALANVPQSAGAIVEVVKGSLAGRLTGGRLDRRAVAEVRGAVLRRLRQQGAPATLGVDVGESGEVHLRGDVPMLPTPLQVPAQALPSGEAKP